MGPRKALVGAGGAGSPGGRPGQLSTRVLTGCTGAPSLQAGPSPSPTVAPARPSPGLHLVWCAWDIWENSEGEVGDSPEPFPI